jgi:hypothetical protein
VTDEQLQGLNFQEILRNIIVMSRVDPTGNEAIRHESILKQTGYCKFWKPQFQQWFASGFEPLRVVGHQDVDLGIRSSPTGRLDTDYIKEARARQ